MDRGKLWTEAWSIVRWLPALLAVPLGSCGGGSTGNAQDSGAVKTYLSVQASDGDADTLHYQWRVTAGTIENRDSPQTVWTMPDGPGLHFAYVVVSDGKGGYAEQQYAVSSDALGTTAAAHAPISRAAPTATSTAWSAGRLRFQSADKLDFTPPGGGAKVQRIVYLADVQVQIQTAGGGAVVFSGSTDLSGELKLPDLAVGTYDIKCATVPGAPLGDCGTGATQNKLIVKANPALSVQPVSPLLTGARNLRLFGHVALADGGVCGLQNEYFSLQSAATVQLQQSNGTDVAPPMRVNRFGDYAIDAAVLANGQYQVTFSCEGYTSAPQPLPAPASALGYVYTAQVELSYVIPNVRPVIVKMVANGPDGNVRGKMIVPEAGVSTSLQGGLQFLSYKGYDTKISACLYYQSIGAVDGCDAQGNLQNPITLDDWQRQHRLAPYDSGNPQVSAVYINRMDLNLVRRMYATQTAPDNIAFVVCNHPGPDGSSQAEVDQVLATGLADQNRVACVAMEWSTSPGINTDSNGVPLPFTKFLTFAPDGTLLASINLDGRGEKYMPGACVACHSGTQYNGGFSDRGTPSPYLGAGFLPFDTGNYLFGSGAGLSEAAQSLSLHDLNMLVKATDKYSTNPSLSRLIDGWYPSVETATTLCKPYPSGSTALCKEYVPPQWVAAEATHPGASTLYREVVGGVCRTCHVAMGSDIRNQKFDWDSHPEFLLSTNSNAYTHFCGGTPDVALNASMPNALISRDRLADRISADPALATLLMQTYLGCVTPKPDPAYAKQ